MGTLTNLKTLLKDGKIKRVPVEPGTGIRDSLSYKYLGGLGFVLGHYAYGIFLKWPEPDGDSCCECGCQQVRFDARVICSNGMTDECPGCGYQHCECDQEGVHYTLDGHKLAPYPDMTDSDLADYKSYMHKVEGEPKPEEK
jgi:hypothetical protein